MQLCDAPFHDATQRSSDVQSRSAPPPATTCSSRSATATSRPPGGRLAAGPLLRRDRSRPGGARLPPQSRRFADGATVPGGVLAGVADYAMTTAVRTTVLAAADVVTVVADRRPAAAGRGRQRAAALRGRGRRRPAAEGTLARATLSRRRRPAGAAGRGDLPGRADGRRPDRSDQAVSQPTTRPRRRSTPVPLAALTHTTRCPTASATSRLRRSRFETTSPCRAWSRRP